MAADRRDKRCLQAVLRHPTPTSCLNGIDNFVVLMLLMQKLVVVILQGCVFAVVVADDDNCWEDALSA